jgi:tripartite-type tricarboxylate transporter receptor subunit TctC
MIEGDRRANRLLQGFLYGALAMCSVGPAAVADEIFQGKSINFVIGYSGGGGYDTYSRLVAAHLGKHLPGNPSVVAVNMPGANSLRATNYLYNEAPRDGTAIGMIDQAIYLNQVLGLPQLRADVTKFGWIGRIVSNSSVTFSWHLAAAKTIQDTLRHELITAVGGAASQLNFLALNSVVGTKLKLITGYAGAGDEKIALERGEIEAMSEPWPIIKTTLADWIKSRKINLLVQSGMEKNVGLDHVPSMVDLARNDADREVLTLFSTPSVIGRSLVAPPGLRPEILAALRTGFMETMKDPDLLRDFGRAKLDLEPLSGADLQAVIIKAGNYPPDVIARAKKIAAFGSR